MNVYESCPVLESERYLLRAVSQSDLEDLLRVYSDKNALPFFNSDNCHGDNFYYTTIECMEKAFEFWTYSYDNRWFARLSIVDKMVGQVIGTVEICLRASGDAFDGKCVLRVDVRSDYENEESFYDILTLIAPRISELLDCSGIITKAPIYAVERISALKRARFQKAKNLLIGHDGYAYDGYWVKEDRRDNLQEERVCMVTNSDEEPPENLLGALLIQKQLTIATAESCTGGLLAATLVDYPGISAALNEAHVTYANEAKVKYCGVKEETLASHGAVSEETAREMAEGMRERSGADIALSTTGIAGPGGGTKEKPVGLVYVACASKHGTQIKELRLSGTRRQVREQTVRHALELALNTAMQYE